MTLPNSELPTYLMQILEKFTNLRDDMHNFIVSTNKTIADMHTVVKQIQQSTEQQIQAANKSDMKLEKAESDIQDLKIEVRELQTFSANLKKLMWGIGLPVLLAIIMAILSLILK